MIKSQIYESKVFHKKEVIYHHYMQIIYDKQIFTWQIQKIE